MFKILENTMNDSDDDKIHCLYFEGAFESISVTPSGNQMVFINDSKFIKVGRWISKRDTPKSRMNILVPRRRVNVVKKLNHLNIDERYVFKLTKESRSNKFVLSEIFLEV